MMQIGENNSEMYCNYMMLKGNIHKATTATLSKCVWFDERLHNLNNIKSTFSILLHYEYNSETEISLIILLFVNYQMSAIAEITMNCSPYDR